MKHEVTEEDFRLPEFRGAKAEDYERRADGKIVRKDRWQNGVMGVVSALGMNPRSFEIDAVVKKADAVYDAAFELVAAYNHRFVEGSGPIDPEFRNLRAALAEPCDEERP